MIEQGMCQRRTGLEIMLAHQFMQFLAGGLVFHQGKFYHLHVAEIVEVPVRIPDIGHATAHTSRKVSSGRAQHNDASARHVLATMIAYSFHHGYGS